MFAWLNTNGAALKNPLPGSTNYLGAYNRQGQLTRVVMAARKGGKGKEEEDSNTHQTQQNDLELLNDTDNGDGVKADKLPPETLSDLVPFPLNRRFLSQPVLSDKFQEHIWKQVIQEGKSVREVSAEVSVEMSRVAAVVRLLEVENEWKRIVRILSSFFKNLLQRLYDDILKNRLVFKTKYMVTKFTHASLSESHNIIFLY